MSDQQKRTTVKLASQRDINAIGILIAILILTIAWLFVIMHRQTEALETISRELLLNQKEVKALRSNLTGIELQIATSDAKSSIQMSKLNRSLFFDDDLSSLETIGSRVDSISRLVDAIYLDVGHTRMRVDHIQEDVFEIRFR